MAKTFVIAEAGNCHDEDIDKAFRLIDAAKECGADAVKFQICSDPEQMATRRNAPELAPLYRKYLYPVVEWLPKLKAKCDELGIEFMCTAYLPKDVCTVAPFVQRFKIASFEAIDYAFFMHHFPYKKPIIISIGMNAEVAWKWSDKVSSLLCVSAYPTPLDELNLARMMNGDSTDGYYFSYDGLSDHTGHTFVGALAVAAGAKIIEAHIRLDETNPDNPDFGHSHRADRTPLPEFRAYVGNIRLAEQIMGDGVLRAMPCEEGNLRYRVRN